MSRTGDLLYVRWEDAVHTAGAMDAGDGPDTLTMHSVGYRVSEDAGRLVLAMTRHGESGEYVDSLTVPKGAIDSVTVLGEGRP